MEEELAALKLPHRGGAERVEVAVKARNLIPSGIDEVGIISRQPVQSLDRVVSQPDVEKVLIHELTGPGHVRVVSLLVEHWAAVTGEATGAAYLRKCMAVKPPQHRSVSWLISRPQSIPLIRSSFFYRFVRHSTSLDQVQV